MSLIECLCRIKDPRRAQGQRYSLIAVLIIIIMAVISGKYAYREIFSFAQSNKKALIKRLKIRRIPSHVTIREVIMRVDFNEINRAFSIWATSYVQINKNEWLSVDGKSIRSTMVNYKSHYQNFISLVSLFSHKRAQVLRSLRFENNQESEIKVVERLLETLDLKQVRLTMDALHCKKNTRYDHKQL